MASPASKKATSGWLGRWRAGAKKGGGTAGRRGLQCDQSTISTALIVVAALGLAAWRISRSPTLKAIGASFQESPLPVSPPPGEEEVILSRSPWRYSLGEPGGYLYGWSVPELGYRLGWPTNLPLRSAPTAARTGGVLRRIGVVDVAASGHTLAISVDGVLYSVGRDWDSARNRSGQLGREGAFSRALAVKGALSGKKVVAAAAGKFHSLAVSEEGTVYSWGLNSRGQLGRVTSNKEECFSPEAVTEGLQGHKVTAVCAGPHYSMALTEEGQLHTWGLNFFDGEVPWKAEGEGEADPSEAEGAILKVAVPRVVGGALSSMVVAQITCGPTHWLAVTNEGLVFAASTGFTDAGLKMKSFDFQYKLGREPLPAPTSPAVVLWGLERLRAVSVAATSEASLAVTAEGAVYSWGLPGPELGRVGAEGREFEAREVGEGLPDGSPMAGLRVVEVAGGDSFVLARTQEGLVFSWGHNEHSQLGREGDMEDITPRQVRSLEEFRALKIAAGSLHGLAIVVPLPGEEAAVEAGEEEEGGEERLKQGRKLLSER